MINLLKSLYGRLMYVLFPAVFIVDYIRHPDIPFVERCIAVHEAWAIVFMKHRKKPL